MPSRLLRRHARSATLLGAGLLVTTVAVLPTSGCTKKINKVPGPTCVGGVVDDEGECHPKCDPDKCKDGNVCVDNECRLECDSPLDCWYGVQSCAAGIVDGTENEVVTVCTPNGHLPVPGTVGQGAPCYFGNGDCTAKSCPNGLECDPNACGGNPADCQLNEKACKGFEKCNIGKCTDGSACTATTCAPDECRNLTCLTGGEGDAGSYCIQNDCQSDADCPGGYYCGVTHDPHNVCGPTCQTGKCSDDGASCNSDGQCQKGNSGFCGQTLEACLDPATFTSSGKSYFEGAFCLLRKSCVRRDTCAPCTTNVDCALGDGDVCVALGGEQVCAKLCVDDGNCTLDEQCLPAGSTCAASPSVACAGPEDCPTQGDSCLPRSACVPRVGSCRPAETGVAAFCRHCVDDTDCGGPDDGWACFSVDAYQRVCFDGVATACQTDADCPQAPSGKHGRCLDESDGVEPTSTLYKKCYLPKLGADAGYGCW